MSHSIEYELAAIDDLKKLTSSIRERIVDKIEWLAQNYEQITPQALKGDLAGFYKLRIDDYRVIYQVDVAESIIIIAQVGHRREIYQ